MTKKAAPTGKKAKPTAPAVRPVPESDEMDFLSPEARGFLKKMEKKYASVSDEEGQKAFATINKFVRGELSWGELFKFTPQEMHDMAKIGYGYFKDSLFDKAEVIFKGLAAIAPDDYYYRQMLGAIFQKRNQLEDAEAHYNDALARNADDIVSYTNRGEVYLRQGRLDKAVTDFEEAIRRDAKGTNKWAARARQLKYRIEHKDEILAGKKKHED